MSKDKNAELTKEDVEPQTKADPNAKKKSKFTKEELLKVFDELIFQSEYREDVTIRGKLRVTFRSRTTEETMEISKILDNQDFKLLSTMQEQRAFQNLLKSLVSYQGRDLSALKVEDKEKFIKKIPTSIIGSLADKLAEFDLKIDEACQEGESNF
jgi:hypothetical protein